RKGDFVVNKSDADIIIYRPDIHWKIKLDKLNTVADYTIYDGYEVNGIIDKVILRGKIVVDKNKLIIDKPFGKFLPRK
ncbi:MAG: dihydropyrimidinase, partial [Endomicrobia bacterium]|nr:dihydropyrimidinase [Endomicrobiia bacterium]